MYVYIYAAVQTAGISALFYDACGPAFYNGHAAGKDTYAMAKKESNAEDLMRKYRRRRRQVLGFFLCFLAVVGLASLVMGGVHFTKQLFDDSEEKAAYEQRLTYIVMLDMLPFESLQQANQSDLLESCLWATLFNEDSSQYSRDEAGALLLPSAEVDRYAAKLFGPDYKLTHGVFESEGMVFDYNSETLCYTIPVTGQVGNYTPKVVEISGTKAVQRVSVGYLAPYSSATDLASNRDVNEPVKYYDYLFTLAADGNYYLTSMEESAWVSSVVTDAAADPTLPGQVPDPNATVAQATNSDADAAIAEELENAQSANESAAEGEAAAEDAAGDESAPDAASDSTDESAAE